MHAYTHTHTSSLTHPPTIPNSYSGDLHYADIAENSLPLFQQAYARIHAAQHKELFRTMPVMYVWDDHDFGANNAGGSSPSKPAATAAFVKYVPANLAAEEGQELATGVYQSYEIQGVLFIVTGDIYCICRRVGMCVHICRVVQVCTRMRNAFALQALVCVCLCERLSVYL